MAEFDPITINSGTLPRQPSRLREWREYQQDEKYAIDGGTQRNRISTPSNPLGFKYNAEMIFERLTSSDYRAIDAFFMAGSGVNYHNPASGKFGTLTFSGLPFPEEDAEYEQGGSNLANYKVRIRQF